MYILKNVYDLDMNAYEEQTYRTRIAKIRRNFCYNPRYNLNKLSIAVRNMNGQVLDSVVPLTGIEPVRQLPVERF